MKVGSLPLLISFSFSALRKVYLFEACLVVLQLPNGESLHERKLRDSLEAEREAVLDFMYTTVDSVSVAFLESFP